MPCINKAPKVDYAPNKVEHLFYEYMQILPQVGTQTVLFGPLGGQNSLFEILPNTSFNLAKSYMEFTFTLSTIDGVFN